ncbi:hypothetical protein F8M41_001104 [Gigaspora margarita]|uniref:Uncharacterized protein n=1 Tax=Gigaspora margarita TaxID=4874 RepID=A0A8H3XEY1_GIGMA|nr:hypothetical protein F8M41_001104 [Gigaspora margarita]
MSNFGIENIAKLLRAFVKNTTKISALALFFRSDYESTLIHILLPALIHFIKSQEQLRKFILDGRDDFPTEFYAIISALKSQKNTLQEVTLRNCVFSAEFEVLNNCKNLKSLRIFDCDTKLLKILDYNISTLEISYFQIDVPIIVQILEKIGILLQRLKVETGTLQFLSVGYAYNTPKEEKKIRVTQFAKILPSTLQYLDITLGIPDTLLDSTFDILLDHCNAPLKKLLISSGSLNNAKNIKALIRYCTRISTLNYVGIVNYDLDYDIRNELEKYVALVPYKHIVVNC